MAEADTLVSELFKTEVFIRSASVKAKKPKSRPIPPADRAPAEIIYYLDKVAASGRSNWEIWNDFLELTLITLRRLPAHLQSALAGETLVDTPEGAATFAKLHERYPKEYCWDAFTHAFLVLLSTSDEPRDTLGDTYMAGEMFSKGAGQYFTPWPVASLMAQIACGDGESEVFARLTAAYERTPSGMMHRLLCGDEEANVRIPAFVRSMGAKILPLLSDYDPIKVMDPCCGSGVMLLAAASTYPAWMNHYGLVQYYGQDLDRTCVKMAQINCLLYGLNGTSVYALDLSALELAQVPEPYQSAYTEAQSATDERLVEIAAEVRSLRQMALF